MTDPCFPARGNRARLKWLPEEPGIIIEAGAEQSVIRFDKDKRERCYRNEEFEPAPPKATPAAKPVKTSVTNPVLKPLL